jgi:hypothetical protein
VDRDGWPWVVHVEVRGAQFVPNSELRP